MLRRRMRRVFAVGLHAPLSLFIVYIFLAWQDFRCSFCFDVVARPRQPPCVNTPTARCLFDLTVLGSAIARC